MATNTGWTYATIDELTLGDVNDLMAYWKEVPPASVSLARLKSQLDAVFFDGDTASSSTQTSAKQTEAQGGDNDSNLAQLLAMFQGGVITPQF